jgi:hypothetical protein
MNTNKQFLAVFVGNAENPRKKAWDAMPAAEQQAKAKRGIEAWGGWMQKHQSSIVVTGGPLGKTKKAGPNGITDISNHMAGFVIVQAESHEAAAKLFENHPHFSIFPGEGVEIMPVLPIPGM